MQQDLSEIKEADQFQSSVLAVTTTTVNLGTAGNYALLAETAITNVPNSFVDGNVGLSPAASSAITGFALVKDGSGQFGE